VYGVTFELAGKVRRSTNVLFEPLPPEMRVAADVIARHIEATYGVAALPRSVEQVAIPFHVNWKEAGSATLFDALFTSEPESLP
jgi:hypothetical protein